MRKIFILLLTLLPISAIAAPQEQKIEYASSKCQVTPSITFKNKKDGYPGRNAIVSSNNLALPAGKSAYAPGQKVYIYGHILDKNCVPVSDAIVEIWHAGVDGKYVTSTLGDRLSPYPDFVGSGRAITNNMGEFKFITLFPGQENKTRTPFIHFRVNHEGFKSINTEMFFANDNRNAADPVMSKLIAGDRERLSATVSIPGNPEESIEVNWDIVLDGTNAFRKY